MASCDTCKAFSALTKECRRHAPTAIPVQQPDGRMVALGIYPATNGGGWCLEHVAQDGSQA